ncbi:alpha/beta fold hydrolase [Hydrogenophaga sp.]|uniref:alpha/beta fold hydrolase n=1 Tax=Hydrogenophaga sp. TaxID=1904254 RepID=UPI002726ABE6|nr:alpha/beta hydrolase [Hydrogenophaga sp.]MDO8905600.1 alpha/beta hydrolase [Hydrogenophaga sp.]
MPSVTHIRRVPHASTLASKSPVLCLHCSGSSGRQWQAYPNLLPQAQVIAPDLLGSGAQGHWLGEHEVSLADEVAALELVLDRAGAPVHLVGHSYGGAVALAVAMRWPERVAGLYLFEPVRFALLNNPADRSAWEEITGVGQTIAAFARSGHLHASAEIFVDYWSGIGTWASLPLSRRDAVAARMPKVRAEFGALFSDDTEPAHYARLPMPVHLFQGSTSPWPARRVVDLLAAVCGATSVTSLQGASHMGPIEEPARFAAQLAPLLGAMDAEAWSAKAA